jgi:OOP family OmpA-OmpF porin
MKFQKALVAATILALPVAATAQPITGLYIGGGVGVDVMTNENFNSNVSDTAMTGLVVS